MKRRALIVGAALALLILSAMVTPAAASDLPRPDWCPAAWECVPTSEMTRDTIFKAELQKKLARSKRFGFTLGLGFGDAAVIDKDLSLHYVPAPGVFLVWGLRF